MKLKRIMAAAVLSAVTGLVAINTAHAQEFKERNIRFGHGMADNHPAGLAAKTFSAEVLKATGGKTKISVIANQALGPDPQMLGALQGGVQEFYTGSVLATMLQQQQRVVDQLIDRAMGYNANNATHGGLLN